VQEKKKTKTKPKSDQFVLSLFVALKSLLNYSSKLQIMTDVDHVGNILEVRKRGKGQKSRKQECEKSQTTFNNQNTVIILFMARIIMAIELPSPQLTWPY